MRKIKILFLTGIYCPIALFSQNHLPSNNNPRSNDWPNTGLTGIWELVESKILKGPYYSNAIPSVLIIEQKTDSILLRATINNELGDTTVSESFVYGKQWAKTDTTKTGRIRRAAFYWQTIDSCWVNQKILFNKTVPSRQEVTDKTRYKLQDNGTILQLTREYDGLDDPNGNQDFSMAGVYKKVTKGQLDEEYGKGKGINFLENLTWDEIIKKAKNENKYIFVDCYATWCGPCKIMDKEVYPLNIVGSAVNDRFISVKVQMDTGKNDPEHVKLLYPVARQFEKKYFISALPSYLFFSPNGDVLHKSMGQKKYKDFIKLIEDATIPEKQLFTLFNAAKNKKIPFNEYPALADRFKKEFYENILALEIARIYKNEYLDNLKEQELLVKNHLDFIGEYYKLISTKDNIFWLCYNKPKLVDSIKAYEGGGWADFQVRSAIIREDVQPLITEAEKAGKVPAWVQLEKHLSKKYNRDLAITYTLDARIDWYAKKKEWDSYFALLPKHLARYDLRKVDFNHLHYCAWYTLKHSDNKQLLLEAIGWMDILIEKTPKDGLWQTMDTKAYLLYKLNRREEGIAIIKEIINRFPQFSSSYKTTLEKMLSGEEIWRTVQ